MPTVLLNDPGVECAVQARRTDAVPHVGARPARWAKAARPLRVLEVCNEFPPTVGGSETHNTGEVDFLCRRGHSVCVLAVRDVEAMIRNGCDEETMRIVRQGQWTWSPEHQVPVYEAADRNRGSLLSLARQYVRLSRRHGPFDVVVVHRAHLLPSFALARRLVLTLHYMELVCPKYISAPLCAMGADGRCDCVTERSLWRNAKWWARRRLSARLMDAVVTKYPHIAAKLLASGIPAGKVHHIPNWIDLSPFGGRRRVWAGMPADVPGWAEAGSFVFALLCRLVPEHGARYALEGFIRLARREHGSRLMVIGDGSDASLMQRRVAEAGLSERVYFLGEIAHENVPAALSWADCGLATSDFDNFGWRLLEMMAAGLPIVATDMVPMREVLRDGVDSELCAVTPDGVAGAMQRILEKGNRATQMGAAAREMIAQNFSPNNLLRYEAVLAGEASAR